MAKDANVLIVGARTATGAGTVTPGISISIAGAGADSVDVPRRFAERGRAGKATKRDTPEGKAAEAAKKAERKKKVERLVPVVTEACVLAGIKPAGTWDCVHQILDDLQPEWRCAPRRLLRDALVLARKQSQA